MVVTNTQMWDWLWNWILTRSWRRFEAYNRKMFTYLVAISRRKMGIKGTPGKVSDKNEDDVNGLWRESDLC